MIIMNTWTTDLVTVNEIPFDNTLHAFEVLNLDGAFLGTINPATIEDMNQIISDLNNGDCPVADGWEDGNGNTCTIEGWDESGK